MPRWGCAAFPKGSVYVQVMLRQRFPQLITDTITLARTQAYYGSFYRKTYYKYIHIYIYKHAYTHTETALPFLHDVFQLHFTHGYQSTMS